MTDNERDPSQEKRPQDDAARIHGELVSIRDRFADTLHLLMPGVDHRLLTLTRGERPHSPQLELGILDWLEDVLLSVERCEPRQRQLLDDDGRTVHVLAYHLLNDFWWVSVLGLRAIYSENGIAGTGPRVALAIARIKGSGRRLPYNAHYSAKFS